MASPSSNLFARLHKWASRQDENFLTESLAVVLEQLLAFAPAVGTRLVCRLTGGFIDLPAENASAIEIQTQVEASHGRPDLEIRSPRRLAWVEVKAESELRTGQLEGYRVSLKGSGVAETRLVLLTRYPEAIPPGAERPDLELRWFEVTDWLENELPAADAVGEVPGFLLRQLLGFLEARGMRLAQVGRNLPDGLRALTNLMNMLAEAAGTCKVSTKRVSSWEDMGIRLDGQKYWFGVDFSEPEKLWFVTRCKVDSKAAGKLGVGEVVEENGIPYWRRALDLDSEAVHFFARSKLSQMQCLEEFLRECLKQARSIETPDQPPIPTDEEEGNTP